MSTDRPTNLLTDIAKQYTPTSSTGGIITSHLMILSSFTLILLEPNTLLLLEQNKVSLHSRAVRLGYMLLTGYFQILLLISPKVVNYEWRSFKSSNHVTGCSLVYRLLQPFNVYTLTRNSFSSLENLLL